jgi:phosphatidate cytidylyltransferase
VLSGLLQRVVTAIVIGSLFVWAIFALPSVYFSYFLLVFLLLGCWEFSKLIKLRSPLIRSIYSLFVGLIAISVYSFEYLLYFILYLSAFWWIINLYWVVSYPQKTSLWFDPVVARLSSGVLLFVPMWLALSSLHKSHGPFLVLLIMAIVWAADTGALITGKTVGRKKLATLVSPKKTIEGVIGGVFFSMLVLLLFFTLTDVDQGFTTTNYAGYFFLVLIVSCVSVLGDLYESLFKRVSGIKDSGNILPGHGGILDRIDSLTAAAPFFVLGVNLL